MQYVLDIESGDAKYNESNIERNLAREIARASPDQQTIDSLRTLQSEGPTAGFEIMASMIKRELQEKSPYGSEY